MLRSFFQEIPLEIQEAAKIDGCTWFGVLTRVTLPLSMPAVYAGSLLVFTSSISAFVTQSIIGEGSILNACRIQHWGGA